MPFSVHLLNYYSFTAFTAENFQPNNLDGDQNCVEVMVWGGPVANDEQCYDDNAVLCERLLETTGEYNNAGIVLILEKLLNMLTKNLKEFHINSKVTSGYLFTMQNRLSSGDSSGLR